MRNVLDKDVEKFKAHILSSINYFFRKSYRLWENVEKYGRAEHATDGNTIRRMRVALWMKWKPQWTNCDDEPQGEGRVFRTNSCISGQQNPHILRNQNFQCHVHKNMQLYQITPSYPVSLIYFPSLKIAMPLTNLWARPSINVSTDFHKIWHKRYK